MKTSIMAAVLTAALATAVTVPTEAQASRKAVVGGIIGGLAAGAIINSAYPYYNYYPGYPAPVYVPVPAAYTGPAYPPPGCVIRQQPVWGGYGWTMRRIRVCY